MEDFNVAIVDDEEYGRSSLYFLIKDNCPEVKIVNISKSAQEASRFIKENEVHLILLDIAMPNENGFTLIPLLQEKNIMVIFTTAFDQYAIKAIKASAVDYLLKPIDIIELKDGIEKAYNLYKLNKLKNTSKDYSKNLETLAENLEQKDRELKKLTIASTSGFKIISLTDIVYLEADSNYCIFHLISGERVVASKPLKEYEEILTSNNFIRVHKSNIINTLYLKEYKNTNGLQVKLVNDITIQVSRRRITEFLEKVKKGKII